MRRATGLRWMVTFGGLVRRAVPIPVLFLLPSATRFPVSRATPTDLHRFIRFCWLGRWQIFWFWSDYLFSGYAPVESMDLPSGGYTMPGSFQIPPRNYPPLERRTQSLNIFLSLPIFSSLAFLVFPHSDRQRSCPHTNGKPCSS